MSIADIERIPRDYLTPSEVAAVLHCDPQDVRVAARQHPELLGFNVTIIGTRVKIPKMAFLRWMTGKEGCNG